MHRGEEVRDELMEKYLNMVRGKKEMTVKELKEIRDECYKTLWTIGRGANTQTIRTRSNLIELINSTLKERFGEWVDK